MATFERWRDLDDERRRKAGLRAAQWAVVGSFAIAAFLIAAAAFAGVGTPDRTSNGQLPEVRTSLSGSMVATTVPAATIATPAAAAGAPAAAVHDSGSSSGPSAGPSTGSGAGSDAPKKTAGSTTSSGSSRASEGNTSTKAAPAAKREVVVPKVREEEGHTDKRTESKVTRPGAGGDNGASGQSQGQAPGQSRVDGAGNVPGADGANAPANGGGNGGQSQGSPSGER